MNPVSAEEKEEERKPWAWRWQILVAALGAFGAVLGGISGFLALRDSSSDVGGGSGVTTTTSVDGAPMSGSRATTTPGSATSGIPVVRAEGTVLGRDLRPTMTETCRTPTSATGSAWQIGPVKLGGATYENGYSCNIFSTGTGNLDFDLGGRFRELNVTVGFMDDSTSLQHKMRFEVIGDGRFQLAVRDVLFGEVAALKVDVSGISRLRLEVNETGGQPDASPSRLAWANASLT